jgi:hypothetical protein
MTELALLRAFLAWETFLEESFILYLLGHRPLRGRAPQRYAFPPNQRAAADWLLPEGGSYTRWTNAAHVSLRAERFFRAGRPFVPVLRSNQNVLEELRTLRNAIAHTSVNTKRKFENLARLKLGVLPPNLTVGAFLGMTIAGSSPPSSFLEFYFSKIEFAAQKIIST